ncbi:MAG TPA: hypothetical protein VG125_00245, partial [Pirellulales bacterium]|nr:hypothetical protein [Pirellulales bacterium]
MIDAVNSRVSTATLEDTAALEDEVSVPPGHVRPGVPRDTWTRDELDARADWEIRKIRQRKSYAPTYWWLGKVLWLVRSGLDRGQWKAWRERHHIDRTRAQRSLNFARVFDSPAEIEGLSIQQATRLANDRLGLRPLQTEAEVRIRRRLLQLKKKTLPDSLDDVEGVSDPRRLLPLIAEVGEQYRQLEDAIAKRRTVMGEEPQGSLSL